MSTPAKVRRVVIKIGTAVLTEKLGQLDILRMEQIAADIAKLIKSGTQVAVVSSGAVGLGVGRLNLEAKPKKISSIQKCAAVGQGLLIETWSNIFKKHSITVAQLLLTRDDVDNQHRHNTLKELIDEMLAEGIVPIINENDSISAAELNIKFGDNDVLSALLSSLIKADFLMIVSTAPGLINTLGDGQVLERVEKIDASINALATSAKTAAGTGGMVTKLKAAQIATSCGCPVVIVSGRLANVILRVLDGENLGTYFAANTKNASSKKRWVAHFGKTKGKIIIDEGAMKALRDKGGSLLLAGINSMSGNFSQGDFLDIVSSSSNEVIARGLSDVSCEEAVELLKNKTQNKSHTIIHRDNLALL